MKKFETSFLLGAATAAHQVEGNNTNSDCWVMEQMEHTAYVEPSLDAVDHYNRYEEDIRLMAEAGLNVYRFSLEWARIEPREGVFEEKEIKHYRSVIRCCKEYGIVPIVTLHHFSSPIWIITKGVWCRESGKLYFYANSKGHLLIMKAHQAAKSVIKELYPDMKVGLTLSSIYSRR